MIRALAREYGFWAGMDHYGNLPQNSSHRSLLVMADCLFKITGVLFSGTISHPPFQSTKRIPGPNSPVSKYRSGFTIDFHHPDSIAA